jgi:hypothetical protein
MSNSTTIKNYTPHIAQSSERHFPLQVGHESKPYGLKDLILHPEVFRSCETSENHFLDTLA